MKGLLLIAVLISTSVFARNYTSISGDKIHFQSESTWVSAYYSKSLCLDGDTYKATIRKCMEWSNDDDRNCLRYGKIQATQPMESTRLRCASWGSDDEPCQRYVRVRYYQNPVKEVEFNDEDGNVLFTRTVTVPNCM